MILLCVDPGLRGCGCALFDEGKLVWASYVVSPVVSGRGPVAHVAMARAVHQKAVLAKAWPAALMVEFPRVYPGMPKTDPNDLLDLAGVAGALGALIKPLGHVFPSDWKGQVPKKVMNERVLLALQKDEIESIETHGAKDHNTLDAVGIGLHHYGRINRKRS